MFQHLATKLQSALRSLTGKGILTEADVDSALRELRLALLEADVALPAIKHLLTQVREKAIGQGVLNGINPGQQVVKIVYDALVELLGTSTPLTLAATPPAVILLCGLQGSGKTTTAGKLAQHLAGQGKRVFLASLDVHRPAAIAQLAQLAAQTNTPVLDSTSTSATERTQQALTAAKKANIDVLILDTAGRLDADQALLDELAAIHKLSKPAATLLVADAQLGQGAVAVANAFKATVPLTGLILTRLDGDMRGGAALSLRFLTGVPILFLGVGEKVNQLQIFRPEGLAGRILGQGDVVELVQKVQQATNEEDTAALEKKMLSGQALNFNDLAKQLRMMQRLGGMAGMLDLLPGMGAMKDKISGQMNDKVLKHQQAIISSMTPHERVNPLCLNAKRRLRIARGSGTTVADVNKLVKMHDSMNQMTKMLRKPGALQALQGMMKGK